MPFPQWTGGEDGLSLFFESYGFINVKNPNTFRFYFCLASLLLVCYLVLRFVRSPYGNLLKATKENEIRVKFLGYNTYIYKLITFALSRAIAAFAGALNTINLSYTNPSLISHPKRRGDFRRADGRRRQCYRCGNGRNGLHDHKQLPGRYIIRWEMFLGIALLVFVFRFRKGIWGYIAKA